MIWLGGLDSNQDSQIQNLESYQLDDLPAGRNKNESLHIRLSRQLRFILRILPCFQRRLFIAIPGFNLLVLRGSFCPA
jgi:hypothetical protein